MPRIPRVRGFQSLQLTRSGSSAPSRAPFMPTRGISTTAPVRDLRSKLWKDGEIPGPEDPYTQRPESQELSDIPTEARQAASPRDRTPRPVRESRLVLPPKRTEATTEREVGAMDPSYTPATTIEGLDEVEPLSKWWDQPGHWGEESQFQGFGRAEKILEKDIVEVYLRRAVVEVLALQQAGKLSEWATKKWSEGPLAALHEALAPEINVGKGGASLAADASGIFQQMTRESDEPEVPERISLEEAREMIKVWDPTWKDIVLDTEAKFAIRKRLYQLTGSLVPDAKLGAARTVKNVLTVASKQGKPKKLAEALKQRSELVGLPNVRLHSKKVGPIDQEVEVGRWKVIEEELKKRDLPVTGTGGLPGNKERKWLRGQE